MSVEQQSVAEQRARWRAAYRVAFDTLHRMHESGQPFSACETQAKIVQQLRADLASTFTQGASVVVVMGEEHKEGEYLGIASYQGLCVYIQNTVDGLLVTVEADCVFGIDEQIPMKETPHALS